MDFLNDLEKQLVQSFSENVPMREAVKKVLLAGLYSNGVLQAGKPAEPLTNAALTFVHIHPEATDAQVGAVNRAYYSGLIALEEGFKHLETYKAKVEDKPKENKAR